MWHRLNNSIAMLLFKLSSALSGISFAGYLPSQNAESYR
jgi:hypothetical protein